MGRLKQLLPFGNRPAICLCLEAISGAGLSDIVVVLGPGADEIRRAIAEVEARTVVNQAPESHMADSVRVGLGAIDPASGGVLICLADHPLVSSGTIRSIVAMHQGFPEDIIVPTHNGRRGHPSLFPRSVLSGVGSGKTLRDILLLHETGLSLLEVPDEGVILDMDTEDDYRRMAGIYGGVR